MNSRGRTAIWRLTFALVLSAISLARAVGAQALRGTVRDSTTGLPIPGAVVMLLDSGGVPLGRTITNERGEYRFPLAAGTDRVRLVRIGFRFRDLPLARLTEGLTQLDVDMTPVPALLDPVLVQAGARCPPRPDRGAAFALLEQARAGLLSTVVAREANPARIVRLAFYRTMVGATDQVDRQTVSIDSTPRSIGSYQAAAGAADFVELGFRKDNAGRQMFYGPDADVLLDDRFTAGYCFHIHAPERARPNDVGLSFVPAAHRAGRVDIDGTLWVDTVARALRDVEFRYLGLAREADELRPGGRVSFREMENGVGLVDRWFLRLPSTGYDTTYSIGHTPSIRANVFATETGGELVSAEWPDGHSWSAPLGGARIQAVDGNGTPVAGATVRLDSTDYAARTDTRGKVAFSNLLPGPYVATVSTPELATMGIVLPTALRFLAVRDSTIQARVLVPAERDFVRNGCSGDVAGDEQQPWLIVRVVGADDYGVANAHWQLSRDFGIPWQRVTETRVTDSVGRVHYCMLLARGDAVTIRAWRDGEAATVFVVRQIERTGTEVTIKLPGRP